MPLVLAVLIVATAIGYARGGRLRGLAHIELHRPWLLAVAVVSQLGVPTLRLVSTDTVDALGPALLAVSFTAVIAFLLVNRGLPGVWLAVAGVGLNALVIIANGAMPVSPDAIATVNDGAASFPVGKHDVLDQGSRLPFLADIIPVPPLRSVVSVGDLLLAAGVARLVITRMGHAPPATTQPAEGP